MAKNIRLKSAQTQQQQQHLNKLIISVADLDKVALVAAANQVKEAQEDNLDKVVARVADNTDNNF